MLVNPIKDGIVLDHITAGKGMELYKILGLSELECTVAVITNATSVKMGKKDIIKIDGVVKLDLDIIGYIDPGVTVNIIRDAVVVERRHLKLPAIISGLCVGIVNILNLYLSGKIPAVIQFPVYNIGNMILTGVLGALIFREKHTIKQFIGFGIGCLGILLIGLFQ
jgi:aspartate carbamoyltransferase regulatory subunit